MIADADTHLPETAAVDGATDAALREVLQRVWGFSGFRPLQREAMSAVLARRDSLVVLPTGGGKSLCFQAPALHVPPGHDGRRGFALVVSPLISLMKDQVDGLRVDGVDAAYLNSTQSPGEREQVTAALRGRPLPLLYVSPERLVGEGSQGFRRALREWGLRFIAVDEAHCISQWGHDFRPEYRQFARLREEFPERPAPRLHRDRDRTGAARHRRPAPAPRSAGAGRIVRPAEPDLPGAASAIHCSANCCR